jgi:hypothetical protein
MLVDSVSHFLQSAEKMAQFERTRSLEDRKPFLDKALLVVFYRGRRYVDQLLREALIYGY